MARVNRVITRLENDEMVFYAGAHTGATLDFEAGVAAASTWADYINVGMEHGPLDLAGLDDFMAGLASTSGDKPAVLVELPFEGASVAIVESNAWIIRQLLSLGVHGFLLCHAEDPAAVAAFVAATRYSFRGGTRGAGSQAYAGARWGLSASEYLDRADPWPLSADGELLLGLKIENKRALQKVEESVAVPGIAFAEWGPADMSMSFGHRDMPDPWPDELTAARERVFAACRANGVFFLDGVTEANLRERFDAGVRFSPGNEALVEFARANL